MRFNVWLRIRCSLRLRNVVNEKNLHSGHLSLWHLNGNAFRERKTISLFGMTKSWEIASAIARKILLLLMTFPCFLYIPFLLGMTSIETYAINSAQLYWDVIRVNKYEREKLLLDGAFFYDSHFIWMKVKCLIISLTIFMLWRFQDWALIYRNSSFKLVQFDGFYLLHKSSSWHELQTRL